MSSEHRATALSVQGVSKTYTITHTRQRPTLFAEALMARARHPFARPEKEQFHALTDVSMHVSKGEAVGIIGRNGAGKSTLLKILSRITQPTTGRIELHGVVGSLLEVGTGFHSELTGRENIFLNGSILGMKRREILRQFGSIVEFAEVERFLDTPVKRYSSGMYVRLAFAVAAHLNPEILIVDEVLAVGDAQFQKRCLGKMDEVTRQQGRTVMFVSHNMAAIESFCTRCVYLDRGRVGFDGPTREAIDRYLSDGTQASEIADGTFDLSQVPRAGAGIRPILRGVELRSTAGELTSTIRMGDGLLIDIHAEGLSLPQHIVYVRIKTEASLALLTLATIMRPIDFHATSGELDHLAVTVPSLPLSPGTYTMEIFVDAGREGSWQVIDRVERAAEFKVTVADVYGSGYKVPSSGRAGLVFVDAHWEAREGGTVVAASRQPGLPLAVTQASFP